MRHALLPLLQTIYRTVPADEMRSAPGTRFTCRRLPSRAIFLLLRLVRAWQLAAVCSGRLHSLTGSQQVPAHQAATIQIPEASEAGHGQIASRSPGEFSQDHGSNRLADRVRLSVPFLLPGQLLANSHPVLHYFSSSISISVSLSQVARSSSICRASLFHRCLCSVKANLTH